MQYEIILNIPDIVIDEVKQKGRSPLLFRARHIGSVSCPHCGEEAVRKRGKKCRVVRHNDIGKRKVWIELWGHKYECLLCARYFNTRYRSILPRRKYTESFRKELVNMHCKGISQSELGNWLKVGSASIERWYHDFQAHKSGEWAYQNLPKYLGIDEHRFSKKVGFATTLCDLEHNQIVDVLPGKSDSKLSARLNKLNGRHNVQMVNMDLSDHYRSLVKKYFPNACIVADRFHVIRLINHHFLKTWHALDPTAKNNRGLLSLMRRHQWHLKDHQKHRFYHYLDQHPGLRPIYDFKQQLVKLCLIKHQSAKQIRKLIPQLLFMIQELKESKFPHLVTLGETFDSWLQEIASMWRFTKNNSITEGFHRKMKLIQRRAYGFKNFENYRLRVLSLCGPIPFTLT